MASDEEIEEIARAIDPTLWRERDELVAQGRPLTFIERFCQSSLGHARAVRTVFERQRKPAADAIDALASAWARLDGKLADYEAERDGKIGMDDPAFTGHYLCYQCEAEEEIKRLRQRGFDVVPLAAPHAPAKTEGE